MKSDRSATVDALRGIAIAGVIGFHLFAVPVTATPLASGLSLVFRGGFLGVDLFFVVSGYLLGGQLFDYLGQPGTLVTFYGRRIARIWPLYLLFLAFGAALGMDMNWPALLTMTQNIAWARPGTDAGFAAMTWSLAVEEQFYLLLPLLIWATPRNRMPLLLYALIGASLALRLLLMARGEVFAARILMPCNLCTLLAGVVLAHATRYRGLALPAIPSPGWLRWLGRRSYAIYLFQRIEIILPQDFAGGALYLILVLITAEILHRLIERPVHAWARRRFVYGRIQTYSQANPILIE